MIPRQLIIHPMTLIKLMALKKEAERSGIYRVARRIHAVILNASGMTSSQIAELFITSRARVNEWLRNYEAFHIEGLLEGKRSGRPSGLSEKQKIILGDIIDSGPVAYGYLSGVWDSKMIASVITNEFNIIYDPRHVRRIIDKMNFSVQRPRRHLVSANAEEKIKWQKRTYPHLKKKPNQRVQH